MKASSSRMRRHGLLGLMVAVAMIGLGSWFGLRVWPEVRPYLSHPVGLILSTIDDDTVYTPGFTHRKFLAIEPGMTREKVERLMGGPPLDVMKYPDSNHEGWFYSHSPGDMSYWRRYVLFKNSRVEHVFCDFYFD